jgi:hypothetical protein
VLMLQLANGRTRGGDKRIRCCRDRSSRIGGADLCRSRRGLGIVAIGCLSVLQYNVRHAPANASACMYNARSNQENGLSPACRGRARARAVGRSVLVAGMCGCRIICATTHHGLNGARGGTHWSQSSQARLWRFASRKHARACAAVRGTSVLAHVSSNSSGTGSRFTISTKRRPAG